MGTFVLIIHIIVAILLVLIVLLQVGKGASLANLFGGGSSEAIFSGAGGDVFLKKVTVVLIVLFMVTSLSLTIISYKQPSDTIMRKATGGPAPQPAAPQSQEAEIPEAAPASQE